MTSQWRFRFIGVLVLAVIGILLIRFPAGWPWLWHPVSAALPTQPPKQLTKPIAGDFRRIKPGYAHPLSKGPSAGDQAREAWEARRQSLTHDEKMARAEREVRRVSLAQVERFVNAAGLPEADREKLKKLLMAKLTVGADFADAATAAGLDKNSDDVRALKESEAKQLDDQIRPLVGDAAFQEITNGISHLPSLIYSVEFVGEAYGNGIQMSHDKIGEMDAAITEVHHESDDNLINPETGLTAYDDRVIERLGPILSAAELDLFKTVKFDHNLFDRTIKSR